MPKWKGGGCLRSLLFPAQTRSLFFLTLRRSHGGRGCGAFTFQRCDVLAHVLRLSTYRWTVI